MASEIIRIAERTISLSMMCILYLDLSSQFHDVFLYRLRYLPPDDPKENRIEGIQTSRYAHDYHHDIYHLCVIHKTLPCFTFLD